MCAFARSTEPSGKSGRSFVIRVSSAHSSVRVRRISSVIVSTRIVSSIVSRPRQSRPSGGGPSDGGGGCIACDRNEVEECVSACAHQAEERCFMADKKDGVGVVEMEEAVPDERPAHA
jgi:hypothetical protein